MQLDWVCVCVCVMLAQFTEMIGILLNNCRDILLGPAIVNMSALLFACGDGRNTAVRLSAVFSCNDRRHKRIF